MCVYVWVRRTLINGSSPLSRIASTCTSISCESTHAISGLRVCIISQRLVGPSSIAHTRQQLVGPSSIAYTRLARATRSRQLAKPSALKAVSSQSHQLSKPSALKAVSSQSRQFSKPSALKALSSQSRQPSKPSALKAVSSQSRQLSKPSALKAAHLTLIPSLSFISSLSY